MESFRYINGPKLLIISILRFERKNGDNQRQNEEKGGRKNHFLRITWSNNTLRKININRTLYFLHTNTRRMVFVRELLYNDSLSLCTGTPPTDRAYIKLVLFT